MTQSSLSTCLGATTNSFKTIQTHINSHIDINKMIEWIQTHVKNISCTIELGNFFIISHKNVKRATYSCMSSSIDVQYLSEATPSFSEASGVETM